MASTNEELREQFERIGIDNQVFQNLEREFQEVIQELSGDASMERFKREFEKLHKALKESHERESEYLKKCKELHDTIVSDTVGVETAIRFTQEDDQKMKSLQRELEGIRKKLRAMKELEEKNQKTIQHLKDAINNMDESLKNAQSMTTGKANDINDKRTKKDELQAKTNDLTEIRDRLLSETTELKSQVDEGNNLNNNMDSELKRLNDEVNDIEGKIKEDENRKQQQFEMESLRNEKKNIIQEKENNIEQKKELKKNIQEFKKHIMEKNHAKMQLIQNIDKMEKEASSIIKNSEEYMQIVNELKAQNREKEAEFKELGGRSQALERKINTENKNFRMKEDACNNLKRERDRWIIKTNNLKDTLYKLEREIDEQNKISDEDKKMISELTRDQNSIRNNLSKAKRVNEDQRNEEQKAEKERQKLERDNKAMIKELENFDKEIRRLEIEKKKRAKEATQANAKYYLLLEEIKLKDNFISEFQKKNLETEARLKQQQTLYETVQRDRAMYSKNLAETEIEIEEIQRNYRIVMHQITQLKEEISSKEQALNDEYMNANTLEKSCQSLEKQNKKQESEITRKNDDIKTFKEEIAKLKFIIKESEHQRTKLKEQFEMIVSERDILGTQLIRRNEELDLLYEKIKIQQSTLKKGEAQYRDKLNYIEELKKTTSELMNELKIFKNQVQEIPDLKRDVHSLQKELTEEMLKVKALSEELENPMNVHRWRKLEGTESEAYEMITKIQTLQKRLILKTDEVKKKQKVIEAQEKMINELRNSMKRQPGISEAEMISQYQETVKEKTHQLRAIENELSIQQTRANEHKYEIERLTNNLKSMKKKVYELKKREQYYKDKKRKQNNMWSYEVNLPEKRFVGGGFNLMS